MANISFFLAWLSSIFSRRTDTAQAPPRNRTGLAAEGTRDLKRPEPELLGNRTGRRPHSIARHTRRGASCWPFSSLYPRSAAVVFDRFIIFFPTSHRNRRRSSKIIYYPFFSFTFFEKPISQFVLTLHFPLYGVKKTPTFYSENFF